MLICNSRKVWQRLFVLDSVNGRLLRQGGPDGMPSPNGGVLTDVGATGVISTGGANFDIVGGHNGVALGIMNLAPNIGAVVAPILVPVIALEWGWKAAFIITGAVTRSRHER